MIQKPFFNFYLQLNEVGKIQHSFWFSKTIFSFVEYDLQKHTHIFNSISKLFLFVTKSIEVGKVSTIPAKWVSWLKIGKPLNRFFFSFVLFRWFHLLIYFDCILPNITIITIIYQIFERNNTSFKWIYQHTQKKGRILLTFIENKTRKKTLDCDLNHISDIKL